MGKSYNRRSDRYNKYEVERQRRGKKNKSKNNSMKMMLTDMRRDLVFGED